MPQNPVAQTLLIVATPMKHHSRWHISMKVSRQTQTVKISRSGLFLLAHVLDQENEIFIYSSG